MKKISILLSLILIMNVFTGCSLKNNNENSQKEVEKAQELEQREKVNTGKENPDNRMRKIRDLTGQEWEIPTADKINKVMIISPPLLSYYTLLVKDVDKLVAVNPLAYTVSGKDFLDVMLPEREHIETGFIKGFNSNTEEVLKINPDIILVYGDFQKKGLEDIDIPVIDFFQNTFDNREWSVNAYNLMKEIFDFKGETDLEEEWEKSEKIVAETLKKVPEDEKKSALIIHQNNGEELVMLSTNSFHADFLEKSGALNVAYKNDDKAAMHQKIAMQQSLLSMEDIYSWDPDIIYDFEGRDADDYLQGKIEGQDWRETSAVKNGKVYDFPQGAYNWGAAGLEGPLTIVWMTMKNYPDTIEETFFKQYMKDYYKKMFGVEIDDSLQELILDPIKN